MQTQNKIDKNIWPLQTLAHFYNFLFDGIICLFNTEKEGIIEHLLPH